MSGLVIWVVLTPAPDAFEALHQAALANAAAAVRDEPGCRRFDVLVKPGARDRLMLYEIYDDEDAFEAHRATPHFLAWREATDTLIEDRVLEQFVLTNA